MNEQHRKDLQTLADHLRENVTADRFHMFCNFSGHVLGIARSIGLDADQEDWPVEDPRWRWLFDSGWCRTDNTPTGAADRIEYFLEHGVPDNWKEQLRGEAPLSYKRGDTP